MVIGKTSKDVIDLHAGERFLVCGDGSSLDCFPESFYTSWPGITIGVNRVLAKFHPTYYLCLHRFQRFVEGRGHELAPSIGISCRNGQANADVVVNFATAGSWEKVLCRPKTGLVASNKTSACALFSMAWIMGATSIWMTGIDFAYGPEGQLYHSGLEPEQKSRGWYAREEARNRSRVKAFLEDGIRRLEGLGVPVFNLSPWSQLGVARKMRVDYPSQRPDGENHESIGRASGIPGEEAPGDPHQKGPEPA